MPFRNGRAKTAVALWRRIGGARALHLPYEVAHPPTPGHAVVAAKRWKARQHFPEVNLKKALRMSRPGAPLPISSAPLAKLPHRRPYYDDLVKNARLSARGDVRRILDAIDRAIAPPPPPLPWAPEGCPHLPSQSRVSEAAVVNELNRMWDVREEQGGGRPMTAQIVLGVLRASHNGAAGIHFFHWAGGPKHEQFFQHSTITYNGLVEMLIKRGFINEAIRAYRIMLSDKFMSSGCGANSATLGLLVRRLLSERANHLGVAINLLNDAMAIEEDSRAKVEAEMKKLQSEFEKKSKKNKSDKESEVKEIGRSELPKSIVLVSDDILHDVVEYLCKVRSTLPLALRFFNRCKYPGAATYQCLVRAMVRSSNYHEAYDLICSMAVTQGLPTDDVTYHAMIYEFCRRGYLGKAQVLLHDFIERGRVPSVLTFNAVLELLRDKADSVPDCADKALFIRECMVAKKVSFTVVTFSFMVQIFAKGGRVDEAAAVFKEMLGLKMDNIDPDTGRALLRALVKADRMQQALDFLIKCKWCEIKCPLGLEDYASVIYGFLRLGKVQGSLNAFRKLKGNVFQPDLTMYNVFIAVLCKKGRFHLAKMLQKEVIASRALGVDAGSFGPFVVNYLAYGHLPEAHGVFKDMLGRKLIPDLSVYKAMITKYCEIGSMEDAVQSLEHMFNNDVYPDEELYEAVILGFERVGSPQACELLRKAMNKSSKNKSGLAGEDMFKAVFRLRSHTKGMKLKKRYPKDDEGEIMDKADDDIDVKEGGEDDAEEDAQLAEIVEEGLGDERVDFGDIEEAVSQERFEKEDEDERICKQVLSDLVKAGVDERRPGLPEDALWKRPKRFKMRY